MGNISSYYKKRKKKTLRNKVAPLNDLTEPENKEIDSAIFQTVVKLPSSVSLSSLEVGEPGQDCEVIEDSSDGETDSVTYIELPNIEDLILERSKNSKISSEIDDDITTISSFNIEKDSVFSSALTGTEITTSPAPIPRETPVAEDDDLSFQTFSDQEGDNQSYTDNFDDPNSIETEREVAVKPPEQSESDKLIEAELEHYAEIESKTENEVDKLFSEEHEIMEKEQERYIWFFYKNNPMQLLTVGEWGKPCLCDAGTKT